MIPAEELAVIRSRTANATEGPWRVVEYDAIRADGGNICGMHDGGQTRASIDANAAFIAHARTDLPRLLDENEKLRAALAEVERFAFVLESSGFVNAATRMREMLAEAFGDQDNEPAAERLPTENYPVPCSHLWEQEQIPGGVTMRCRNCPQTMTLREPEPPGPALADDLLTAVVVGERETPTPAPFSRTCHLCLKVKDATSEERADYLLAFHYDRRHKGWTITAETPTDDEPAVVGDIPEACPTCASRQRHLPLLVEFGAIDRECTDSWHVAVGVEE